MPIQLLPEDIALRDEILENKIFEYLLEPLEIDPTIISERIKSSGLFAVSKSGVDKLGETIWTFLFGKPSEKRIVGYKAEKEAVGLAYSQQPEKILAMVDRLHELLHTNTGNKYLDDAVKFYSKSIIDHLYKSQSLFDQISIKHLEPIVRRSRGEIIEIAALPKKSGDQTGTIVDFTYGTEGKNIKFYVKTHQNYKIGSTTGQAVALSGAGEQIDYKELMIYKILEYTKFGPKCSFVLHPLTRAAILIATQAADFTKTYPPECKFFLEGSKLQDKSKTLSKKDSMELNGIDLIARILNITDLNGDNYGRVTVENEWREVQKIKWKIIDFRKIESRDNSRAIYEEFIDTTKNKSFVVEGGFVESLVRSSERGQKQQIAVELVKSLDKRLGTKISFEEAVDNSFTDIMQFLVAEENMSYLCLREESVRKIAEDLRSYSKTVKTNYNAFKEAVRSNQREGDSN